MPSTATQLRERLQRPEIIRSFAAHDVFVAKVFEAAGIELLFLGGFGVAASCFGLPDVGLLTLTDMTEAVRKMAAELTIPLIADGDTGHGDVHNVARTVREFERAGAAGVILEDQTSPKRCGHFEGKQVISPTEMSLKLKAAIDARASEDFVILARTDALAVNGVADAIARAQQYADVGADICFVEAPASREDLARIADEISQPLLANMLLGGTTPILSAEELQSLGYAIVVDPISSLLATGWAVRRIAEAMQSQGRVDTLANEMLGFNEVKQLLGYDEIMGLRDRLSDG